MASPILHIKDTYYFEVPKFMYRWHGQKISDFPEFWVRNDEEFQKWEAKQLYKDLARLTDNTPGEETLLEKWEHWQHDNHKNYAKPLDVYLHEKTEALRKEHRKWAKKNDDRKFKEFLHDTRPEFAWFALKADDPKFQQEWAEAKREAGGSEAVKKFAETHKWSKHKIEEYNTALHGKILIPQVFGGRLRNLYQPEAGFCISKFMVIELIVALVIVAVFSGLARRVKDGSPPRGRWWNFLEGLLLFVRDEVAGKAMGDSDVKKYSPLLWTLFLFIFGSNLMGLMPWAGAPTGAFAVTLALAFVTICTGILFGIKKFGPVGFWLNQAPEMELPLILAVVIKPLILAIEVFGFFVKHGVLAIRLLANIVAGHLVLLSIMGLAFSLEAATDLGGWWPGVAGITIAASTAFNVLELLVAFLQACIFTFLSALFISFATHKH